MTKQKVLITTTPKSDLALHLKEFQDFQKIFEVLIYEVESRDELIHKFQTEFTDIDAIWVTGESIDHFGGVLEFIDYFPSTVKVYVFPWVGYLPEEAKAMKEREIIFCNGGDVSAHEVADHALLLTLSTFKLNSFFENQFRSSMNVLDSREVLGSKNFGADGQPEPTPERVNLAYSTCVGGKKMSTPGGKIAGIVGFGSIGKEVGKRLTAIGMEVRYTKRTPLTKEEEKNLGYKVAYYPSFNELIAEVDLIVLAVPHTPQTIDLINKDSLKLVKRGVRIVNVGRGSAIDEEALINGLEDGTIASAGLDVFRNEPNVNKKLAHRWDVTITPHIANMTTDNTLNVNHRSMKNIINILIEGGNGFTSV